MHIYFARFDISTPPRLKLIYNVCSDVVNIELLLFLSLLERTIIAVEIELALVDLDVLWEFSELLELLGLLVVVLEDDVALVLAEVSQAYEHDVAVVDPHAVLQTASDGAHTLDAVHAVGFNTPVSEHAQHLAILLALLLEDKLTPLLNSKVLRLLTVLSSLS